MFVVIFSALTLHALTAAADASMPTACVHVGSSYNVVSSIVPVLNRDAKFYELIRPLSGPIFYCCSIMIEGGDTAADTGRL
jgi:hypothetical protein